MCGLREEQGPGRVSGDATFNFRILSVIPSMSTCPTSTFLVEECEKYTHWSKFNK